MPHGNGKLPHKRIPTWNQAGSLYITPSNGIGAVEDHHFLTPFFCSTQALCQRILVGIHTASYYREIKQQRIDLRQCFFWWLTRLGVQAKNRQLGFLMETMGRFNHIVLFGAKVTMLWGKKQSQPSTKKVPQCLGCGSIGRPKSTGLVAYQRTASPTGMSRT